MPYPQAPELQSSDAHTTRPRRQAHTAPGFVLAKALRGHRYQRLPIDL